jgi:signal transduction histidine kinase
VFGIGDGLSTLACTGGRPASGLKAPDGKLWFPTMGGVAVVEPGAVRTNTQAPPVLIEALLVRGEPIDFRGDVRVSPGANRFEIRYTAPTFVKPEHLTFRHRLVGLDDGWEDAGDQRTATYYGVPPGRYQFMVSAANADGVWNADGDSVSIVVLAPVWRQPWFMALTGLATVAFVFVLDRRRLRRLRREETRQTAFAQQLIEAQESERKRISTELHDSLGQDLFIIRAHVRSAREMVPNADQLEDALDAIGDLAQRASEDLKNVAHALRPYGLDKIGLASTIERMIENIRTTCQIDFTTSLSGIDGRVDSGKHINVFRIVQEAVSNVVKHSRATRAAVTLTGGERAAEIRIEDNGQGFRPERLESPDNASRTLGLMSIRERARSLGGQATIRSTTGVGTTVVVTFPLDERGHAR